MTNVEISYIIASCTSAILAIVAIVLSIIFFRMSLGFSESAKEASKSISACVERVEKLFDKLYADTFSMMKETYSDIRKHMWPGESTDTAKITEEAEIKAEEKITSLKSEMDKELLKMFQKQEITDKKLSSTRDEMRHLLDKAISSSRRVEIEAREETVRNQIRHLIRMMQRERKKVVADEIVDRLANKLNPSKVISEMEKMVDEGELSLSTDSLGPETIIKLLR